LINPTGQVYQTEGVAGRIPQAGAKIGWIGIPYEAPSPSLTRPRSLLEKNDIYHTQYLVIAPQKYHKILSPLMEKRSEEDLSVFLASPEQVYDTFGQGFPDGSTITSMVNDLDINGRLDYLLLVGDASADIPTRLDDMYQNVPTGWVKTEIVGETPSDFALVSDEKGTPRVAVGRWPVASEAEVRILVNKTLEWTPNRRMLFVGDDEVEFDRFIDKLANVSPVDERLSAGQPDARDTLLTWLRQRPGIMIYSGHGSLPVLGDERLLTQEDAGSWDKPTIVVAWSCLCASFTHPSYQGLGERWLTSRNGTVAFVGPTGETTSAQQAQMAVAVQQAIVAGERIGDALLKGWESANSNDAKVSFLLLGDPALRPFATESE
jgi:hypothetical protein